MVDDLAASEMVSCHLGFPENAAFGGESERERT
jgi:hypothetical protein